MDFEERLQVPLQSTESLHTNVQKLTASVQQLTASIVELRSGSRDLVRVVEVDADNTRRLANIAAVQDNGIEDLSARLDRLERRKSSPPEKPQ